MFDYVLVRSNRKSIGITIKNNSVTVRAPQKLSRQIIEEFVAKNSEWIIDKLESQKRMYDEFSDILEFKKFILYGKLLNIVYYDGAKVKIEDSNIYLPKSSKSTLSVLVERRYRKEALKYFNERVNFLSKSTQLNYSEFKLTNASGKWGSCSVDKVLLLNWRLVLLPTEISDYVIIHELCHTKQLNHSKEFWNLVEKYWHNHKSLRKTLKHCALLIDFCRSSKC